jgi:CubicO group peptidase (beta-lactamase class C family)
MTLHIRGVSNIRLVLSLSDDVRKHVPELPDYLSKITLDHMLTHTSGLCDWPGLLNLADGDRPRKTAPPHRNLTCC